jgi:CHAT domain-containing protein
MTRFYRYMFEKKLSPPAALRAAQLDLMKNTRWKALSTGRISSSKAIGTDIPNSPYRAVPDTLTS